MEIYKYIENIVKSNKEEVETPGLSDLINVFNLSEAKLVTKPWGFELWLADGTQGPYAFKIIGLKEGHKTSLQYHEQKTEHNFLISGTAKLHYENQLTGEITSSNEIHGGHVIQVKPPAIHRIEAITDVLLIEASSTELDDVIRLSDDYSRPDGRIDSEHNS